MSTTCDNTGTTTMEEFTFVCSECAQEIAVNEEMRDAILDNGCPVCAAAVTAAEFS